MLIIESNLKVMRFTQRVRGFLGTIQRVSNNGFEE